LRFVAAGHGPRSIYSDADQLFIVEKPKSITVRAYGL
jgi:hypothetical protein